MQAFYSATFTEAVGAVVGLGLLRNMAPMMTGLTLSGLCAVHFTTQLRTQPHAALDDHPGWTPDRDVTLGRAEDPRTPPEPARLAAVRIVATMIVGPIFVLWGTAVGTLVGMGVARSMLGVSPAIYLGKIAEMIMPVDALGLVVKGAIFAFVAALLGCYEGLRDTHEESSLRAAVFRATCFAMIGVLAVNSSWFSIAYLSGSPFGPTLARN
jgi:phospholipid/cholesterol/gamma-HCH transport system permease protein